MSNRDRRFPLLITGLLAVALVLSSAVRSSGSSQQHVGWVVVTVEVAWPTPTPTRTPQPSCPTNPGTVCWEATKVPTATVVPTWPGRGPAHPGMMYRMPVPTKESR